jgi:hypothetical protein
LDILVAASESGGSRDKRVRPAENWKTMGTIGKASEGHPLRLDGHQQNQD